MASVQRGLFPCALGFWLACSTTGPSTDGNASGAALDAGRADAWTPQPDAAPPADAAGPADAAPPADAQVTPADAGRLDAAMGADHPLPPDLPDPVLFVHGINGSAADFATLMERLVADGWPQERLMARTFESPGWGCNVDNAVTLQAWAQELMDSTGATRVDVVAHSMGSLSSRQWVKNLGGTAMVNTYISLGGMNHGLSSPCLSPLPVCVWKELCSTGELVTALNDPPATPPPTRWVVIYSDGDDTVPADSSPLEGAENIMVPGVEHDGPMGLQQSLPVYEQVKRVLQYPGH
jgi:triacylglycerol lipase